MDRREFLKRGAGATAALAVLTGNVVPLLASVFQPEGESYDLVAVRGGEPPEMFDAAIKAMGGMSQFVKPGQTVVVKPNIGWDVPPERGANTHPGLVGRIVQHCLSAGAKKVYVFDNTCDKWDLCYKNSGIEKAVRDAGGQMVPGHTENYYQPVQIPDGRSLKSSAVHEVILSSDVFINVPVLKHHGSARLTIAMKNLMGIIWDRRYWHRNNLHQCIADFGTFYRKPDLNVVDAYRVMKQNGPRGVSAKDVVMLKSLIISKDMVAADAAAALLFGTEPSEIPYLRMAAEMKVGTLDLNQLNIQRIRL